MKKSIWILLWMLLFCMTSFAAEWKPVEAGLEEIDRQEAYGWIDEQEIPKDFIEAAPEKQILRIYKENKDAQRLLFRYQTAAFNEAGQAVDPDSQEADLNIRVLLAFVGDADGMGERVNCYIQHAWREDMGAWWPFADAIAFFWDEELFQIGVGNNFTAGFYRTNEVDPYQEYDALTHIEPSNLGWEYDLTPKAGALFGHGDFYLVAQRGIGWEEMLTAGFSLDYIHHGYHKDWRTFGKNENGASLHQRVLRDPRKPPEQEKISINYDLYGQTAQEVCRKRQDIIKWGMGAVLLPISVWGYRKYRKR